MLAFNVKRVPFPSTTNRDQTVSSFVDFPRTVSNAHIALNGYDVSYRNGDHHLGELRIDCSDTPTHSGVRVDFNVNLLLRDFSGNIDDAYGGWVDVLVIADLQ
jgi:hypothetical protein